MTCWHLSSQEKTSIQYVQEVYYHYDAKRATDALSTGRGQLKGATGTDWMRDPYIHDSSEQELPSRTLYQVHGSKFDVLTRHEMHHH